MKELEGQGRWESRLKWYGHVLRREDSGCAKRCKAALHSTNTSFGANEVFGQFKDI